MSEYKSISGRVEHCYSLRLRFRTDTMLLLPTFLLMYIGKSNNTKHIFVCGGELILDHREGTIKSQSNRYEYIILLCDREELATAM